MLPLTVVHTRHVLLVVQRLQQQLSRRAAELERQSAQAQRADDLLRQKDDALQVRTAGARRFHTKSRMSFYKYGYWQ